MRRAHEKNAVNMQKFYFRKHIAPPAEALNASSSSNNSSSNNEDNEEVATASSATPPPISATKPVSNCGPCKSQVVTTIS